MKNKTISGVCGGVIKIAIKTALITCKVCGNDRKPGLFYHHRDKHPITLKSGEEVNETEICAYCLFDHMAEHYPGSPNHRHLAERLDKDVDFKEEGQQSLF